MFSEVHFRGYKGFPANKDSSLVDLKHVNIIIGKNNSGKSSILDVIAASSKYDCWRRIKPHLEVLNISFELTEDYLGSIFSNYVSLEKVRNPHEVALQSLGKLYSVSVSYEKNYGSNMNLKYTFSELHSDDTFKREPLAKYWKTVADNISRINNDWEFRRISADRDIVPEVESQEETVNENGVGASNLIRKIINHSAFDEKLIEEYLLKELNKIISPEIEFVELKIQQITVEENLLWEIFLREKDCGRYALSQSGSGLKTIMLLLLNLLIIPETEEYKKKKIIYGFEELENNLHPFVQRKIFDYIYDYSIKNDVYFFLTTHSHVAINAYFDREQASIYHVYKQKNQSNIKKIDNYIDKVEILNDLDVKASDLLQSNGIVWLEGPSDRVYIKRWLDVFCDCKYDEGIHYQFMYYGGRLLSHYTTEETDDLINILMINRNAAIVIDSDKRNRQASLNNTKKRIIEEFSKCNMFSWITKGKEIENYISAEALSLALSKNGIKQCTQYQLFPDYIKKHYPPFNKSKVEFANSIKDSINQSNSKDILDLEKQVKKLYSYIEKWNRTYT